MHHMKQLQQKLIRELTALRKGEGATPPRLGGMSALRYVTAQTAAVPAENLTDNQVYNFLVSELSRLPGDNTTQALKSALGINSPYKKLSQRRANTASLLGKHPDTVELYENRGISIFAAHLVEGSLRSGIGAASQVDAQAKATRAMTVIGLASHLSLPAHGDTLMSYLEMPRKPYLDATVHITLLPSSRGLDWYRFRLSYIFHGRRDTFRVAVVLNRADGERLMAGGLVDDYHGLDDPNNVGRDIKTIIASSKLILRNPQSKTQKLLRFHEIPAEDAEKILGSASSPQDNTCWLLEVVIPPKWQADECTYEYLSFINLPIASIAYWYSPTLMYLKKLTLDFSQFPRAEKRDFFLVPFLGHAPGMELSEKHLYILKLNNWIMPGHGLVLGWQDTIATK